MKVVLTGPALWQRGGVVSVMQSLLRFLADQNVDVQFIPTTSGKNGWRDGIIFSLAWLKVFGICLFRHGSIVHLHMASRGSCLRKSILSWTCLTLRIPYIVHLHGGGFINFYEHEVGDISKFFIRLILRHAAAVITLSDASKLWLEKALGVNQVSVVFNGVHAIDELTKQVDEPTILFLGLLGQNKGTDILISAMRQVSKHIPEVVLELAGDGDIEHYRELAKDLPNVRFLGWVDAAERQNALARASVYCLPSWKEGLPMSILEAMSAAVPVVSTPVGGIPHAVIHGVTGLLVQPGDVRGLATALCQLLNDPDMATAMGTRGQERHSQLFSTEAMGQRCLEIYASCRI